MLWFGTRNKYQRSLFRSLEFTERTLRWHKVLLGWTEQQRPAVDPEPPTRIQEDSDNQTTVPVTSDAVLSSNTPRPPKLRQTKGKHLGPLRPRRVSKAKRLANAGANPGKGHSLGADLPRGAYILAPGALMARSGRLSRPPVRWTSE